MNSDLKEKLIVALDVADPEKAFALVDDLGDLVHWYKVGPLLFTRAGSSIIDFLHRKRKSIFLDLKLYDTPRVVTETMKELGGLGIKFVTVHTMGGHRMLEAASLGCRGTGLRVLGITFLTSLSLNDLGPGAWGDDEADLVERLTDLAQEHRLSGILCSSHEIPRLRSRLLPGTLVVSAGIRPSMKEVYQEDQVRVSTPEEALDAGADYLIIGRPVLQAREPRKMVEHLHGN